MKQETIKDKQEMGYDVIVENFPALDMFGLSQKDAIISLYHYQIPELIKILTQILNNE